MKAFTSYDDCVRAARLLAREQVAQGLPAEDAERGVEYNALYRTWTHFALPRRGNRYGHETQCEVVKPTDPL